MAPNLTSGAFKIVSIATEGEPPVGVNLTKPGFQKIYLNAPVTKWNVEKSGEKTYRLRVSGYPFTGLMGKKVVASINHEQDMEWIATYGERQDAYMITPVNDRSVAWTVADPDATNSAIVVQMALMAPSEPPVYMTKQLFRFEEADN